MLLEPEFISLREAAEMLGGEQLLQMLQNAQVRARGFFCPDIEASTFALTFSDIPEGYWYDADVNLEESRAQREEDLWPAAGSVDTILS